MTISQHAPLLSYDDTGGDGDLVVLLPGAGDVRSEHRGLSRLLAEAGHRVVAADLPGHGDSPVCDSYGVAETAGRLLALVDHLGAGPAAVVGASFSPAAAVWAATTDPTAIRGIVAISPHMEAESSFAAMMQRVAMSTLLRGPLAGPIWSRLYRSWYPSAVPDDMDEQLAMIETMMQDPERRRAVRETLLAGRDGMGARIDEYQGPALVVFGAADNHFPDPKATGSDLADRLDARLVMVEGAGHYPHVEHPDLVAEAILEFLERTG